MKDGKSGWVLVSPQREQDVAVPYNLDIDAIAREQRQPEGWLLKGVCIWPKLQQELWRRL